MPSALNKIPLLDISSNLAGGFGGTLTAVGTQISFPSGGAPVNFVAYSPYNASITAAAEPTYPVNVSTQTTQQDIDLIYHPGTTDYTRETPTVSLVFTHRLSKIRITITKDPTSADFTPAGTAYSCNLVGFPRQATFNLATGALASLSNPSTTSSQLNPLFNPSASTATALSFEAILVPHTGAAYASRSFTTTIGSATFTYNFPTGHSFTAGQRYTYSFQLLGAQLILTNNTITDWTAGESYTETITH